MTIFSREEMTIIIIEVWQHLHIQLRQYLKRRSVSKSREVLLLMQIWYLLSDNECDLCDEEFNCLGFSFIKDFSISTTQSNCDKMHRVVVNVCQNKPLELKDSIVTLY